MLSNLVYRRHTIRRPFASVIVGILLVCQCITCWAKSLAAMMCGHELRLPIDTMIGPSPEAEHDVVASSEYVQCLEEALQAAYELVRVRLGTHYGYEKKRYDRKI